MKSFASTTQKGMTSFIMLALSSYAAAQSVATPPASPAVPETIAKITLSEDITKLSPATLRARIKMIYERERQRGSAATKIIVLDRATHREVITFTGAELAAP